MIEIENIQEITCCYRQPSEPTVSFISRIDKVITVSMWSNLDTKTKVWYNNLIKALFREGNY